MLKRKTKQFLFICSILVFVNFELTSDAELFGPTPYLSIQDSPFTGLGFDYFHVEDFEDGVLNTPGLNLLEVSTTLITFPGTQVDSVDADSGAIDGFGNSGRSLLSNGSTATFNFNIDDLGKLPTHAGLVWTDVGESIPNPGFDDVEVEAFDAGGASLGVIGPTRVGDGLVTGQTAEDRFFGFSNIDGGIGQITLRSLNSFDWEIDHIQYGAVPEPSTYALFLSVMIGMVVGNKIYCSNKNSLS